METYGVNKNTGEAHTIMELLEETDMNFQQILFDKDYNFQEIITLTNELIMLSIENFKIKITGSDLKIKKINSSELLIEGNIISIGKIYE